MNIIIVANSNLTWLLNTIIYFPCFLKGRNVSGEAGAVGGEEDDAGQRRVVVETSQASSHLDTAPEVHRTGQFSIILCQAIFCIMFNIQGCS